jgi:uncharacterized delta-60 repeat protein
MSIDEPGPARDRRHLGMIERLAGRVAATALEEITRKPALLNDWLERRELEPLLDPRLRRGWRITMLNWLRNSRVRGKKLRVSLLASGRVAPVVVAVLCTAGGTLGAGSRARVDGRGTIRTAIGQIFDQANAVVRQPDGMLLVVGDSEVCCYREDFAVARYSVGGSLDLSFGHGGKVKTAINDGRARAALLQPDGKLVAAGGTDDGFALVRYNPDGSLDTGFGDGGKTTTAFGDRYGPGAFAIVRQPDGKLVAAGDREDRLSSAFGLVRYNPNGGLDKRFGRNGKTTTSFGADSAAHAAALVLQPDGKLVVAGERVGRSAHNFTIVRYSRQGEIDASFGQGGIVTTTVAPGGAYANALLLQPDGKLVVGGFSYRSRHGHASFTLARYKPDGSLDISFGQAGIVATTIGPGNAVVKALVRETDGKLVAAGYSANRNSKSNFTLARYGEDGRLDSRFGQAGIVTTAIGPGRAYANALLLQPDGKIVAVGHSTEGRNRVLFTLARYTADGSLDPSFGHDGK